MELTNKQTGTDRHEQVLRRVKQDKRIKCMVVRFTGVVTGGLSEEATSRGDKPQAYLGKDFPGRENSKNRRMSDKSLRNTRLARAEAVGNK